MTPIQYNGYSFLDISIGNPWPLVSFGGEFITVSGIVYNNIGMLNSISEDEAIEIHPTLIVTIHVPVSSKYEKPECTKETFSTHKEALIRYLQFNHKLNPEDTVVLKKKETEMSNEINRVIDALSGLSMDFDKFSLTVNHYLVSFGIDNVMCRVLSEKTIIPVLTYHGVGIVNGSGMVKQKAIAEVTKFTKYLFVKAVVIIFPKGGVRDIPETINGKPIKIFEVK